MVLVEWRKCLICVEKMCKYLTNNLCICVVCIVCNEHIHDGKTMNAENTEWKIFYFESQLIEFWIILLMSLWCWVVTWSIDFYYCYRCAISILHILIHGCKCRNIQRGQSYTLLIYNYQLLSTFLDDSLLPTKLWS